MFVAEGERRRNDDRSCLLSAMHERMGCTTISEEIGRDSVIVHSFVQVQINIHRHDGECDTSRSSNPDLDNGQRGFTTCPAAHLIACILLPITYPTCLVVS